MPAEDNQALIILGMLLYKGNLFEELPCSAICCNSSPGLGICAPVKVFSSSKQLSVAKGAAFQITSMFSSNAELTSLS